jgi:hypothetical protein
MLILDLSFLPSTYVQIYEFSVENKEDLSPHLSEDLVRYLVTWPLIAATSIVSKTKDAPFKEEYIIPQLLMQWVSQTHKLDGIKYLSTKAGKKGVDERIGNFINYVFPVKTSKKKGLCHFLTDRFLLTLPVSGSLATNPDDPFLEQDMSNKEYPRTPQTLSAILTLKNDKNKRILYDKTAFAEIEFNLIKKDLEKIISFGNNSQYLI